MNSKITPFGLRMPSDINEWVEAEAARNLRSKNSEIVMALKEKMERQKKTKGEAPA
ncbi:Arc family DNA-binding protein [Rhizobium sp. SU303]|uniref:Arc family DNA-binding protein n=1 Tax=Rhizobium sp. SU303 TaxID=3138065 RepID=UPI001E39089D|nr:Arc family DNA-binding protein [Rhizobium leguminosarum]UFW80046.1 Arc family DNA-binding protein [Rhizobium leguminosarum bv. viciae]